MRTARAQMRATGRKRRYREEMCENDDVAVTRLDKQPSTLRSGSRLPRTLVRWLLHPLPRNDAARALEHRLPLVEEILEHGLLLLRVVACESQIFGRRIGDAEH